MRPLMIIAALLLLTAGSATAGTLHVPSEYSTINQALDASAFGDTVLVAPGTYDEAESRIIPWNNGTFSVASIAFLPDGVVLRSEGGPDVTTIDFGNPLDSSALFMAVAGTAVASGVTVEGFRIDGGGRLDRSGICLDSHSGDLTVRDCIIEKFNSRSSGEPAIDHAGSGATVRIEGCEIRNCRSNDSGGIRFVSLRTEITDTIFEDCIQVAVWLQNGVPSLGPDRLTRCSFIGNESSPTQAALVVGGSHGGIEILDCRFERNERKAVSVSLASGAECVIEGCLFLGNGSDTGGSGRAALDLNGGTFRVEGNTFWANKASGGSAVGASSADLTLRRNIIGGSPRGAALQVQELNPASGCNLFWANVDGNWGGILPDTLGAGFESDPQFCDADGADFRVAASSPCLPDNNFADCTGIIGAFGESCPLTGFFPVGLRTLPDPVPLLVDGQVRTTPRLDAWEVGSLHEIGPVALPTEPTPGTRYWLQSWSDGGESTHSVTALPTLTEYVAEFSVEHFLSAVSDSGGTASSSEWVPAGEMREVLATPDPGYRFERWVGDGAGSYDGVDNPATVTLNGPVQQRAVFLPLFYPLTMSAQGGGTVLPESGPQPRTTAVIIEAIPDEGRAFSHWIGVGPGSHSGTLNPGSVFMSGAIEETAVFVDAAPALTMSVVGGGEVTPSTGPQDVFTQVQIQATPQLGWAFDHWSGQGSGSYSGGNNPAIVTMNEPLTQTATFVVGELALTVLAEAGGTVTPESGAVTSFTDVEIEAMPDPGYRFVEWKGEGDGSYTGTENAATVTLNGPITQVAHFEEAAFSATLSLSETDPYVHTGSAIGLGAVHLWVTCSSTDRGLQSIALKTTGSLQPLTFLPAPGVSASGTGTVLASIDGCPDGAVRLGSFLVNSPGEGSLCLDGRGTVTGLTITDCEGATYAWPENVGFVGVNTGGGQPCGGGTGCEEIDPFAVPVGTPDIATPVTDTRLAGIFPNPFGTGTTVHFELARPMDVRLTVFDVAGRQVKVLSDGSVPVGRHSVGWDGRDTGGRAVAGGVYFVRLVGDGVNRTEKVTVVRGRGQ